MIYMLVVFAGNNPLEGETVVAESCRENSSRVYRIEEKGVLA